MDSTKKIIKDDKRTSMNEQNTFLNKNSSLSFYSQRGTHFVVSLRDRWRGIYSEKGLLLPGARGCQHLHLLASRIISDNLMPLIGSISLARLSILTGLTV